ncbi:glycosyltransferase family 4 protein [Halobaculum sp. CBA1158]|uniref:glycosyltransferase family 4 protein n=1 Tax=Halobaculum sp. CBA1158 TaxID=2904243 RepID=UPI001F21E409|nr:glycosyltransferase family 4 protein [Halobaculum sp. CBA1158]UIO99997.1 glycosyltransferase family 4 protein [Halobaculum sp. CBA1158]
MAESPSRGTAGDSAAYDGLTVALVVPGDPDTTSGGFRYDRRLVAGLRAAGASVRAFSVPWRRYPIGVLDAPGLATGIPTGLREADAVVVDELAHPGAWGLVRRLRRGGTPAVALVHHLRHAEGGRLAPVAARLERLFLRGCSAAVCVSDTTARDVTALVGDDVPTHVAPPPADQFDPDVTAADVTRRAGESPFRVVALGSLVPRKGHGTLLQALAGLDEEGACCARESDADRDSDRDADRDSDRDADRDRDSDRETTVPDWRLAVVGPEPNPEHRRRVRALAGDLGVADRVSFRGRLSTPDLAAVLRESHALAVPSTYEGFGMAYLEGMGFGLPAVASAAGGASSVVADGETGFLVDPGDVAGVRDALATLATDRDALARMGAAALDRFASHPPWGDTVAGVAGFLAEVADGG